MMYVDPAASGRRFYGKYRGIVLQNIDPEQIGRIRAQVPEVYDDMPSSWALPCVPVAGSQAGCFVVPPIGSSVWIEFEQGNPDNPIWTGGFWKNAAEVPVLVMAPPAIFPGQNILLQTTGQNVLLLSDAPATSTTGGILLKSADGASLVINASGIFISNGKGASVTLVGPIVDINVGALVVP